MKDRVWMIRQGRNGEWRIQVIIEHGRYAEKRPSTWEGPFPTKYDADLAAYHRNLDKQLGAESPKGKP